MRVDRVLATVLFFDIVGSTERLARVGDQTWRILLDDFRRMVRRELERFDGREIDTRGDDFLVIFTSPSASIAASRAIRDRVRDLGDRAALGAAPRRGRAPARRRRRGHGAHRRADPGARAPGQILVSSTFADAVVGSQFRFRDLGDRELKGVPRSWRVYELEDV